MTNSIIVPNRLHHFFCILYEFLLIISIILLTTTIMDILTKGNLNTFFRQIGLISVISIYFILSLRKKGQTLPMKIWNIQLLEKNGNIPNLSKIIIRYTVGWILILSSTSLLYVVIRITGKMISDFYILMSFPLLFSWTFIDPDKQLLHDRIIGTRLYKVVHDGIIERMETKNNILNSPL
ncbi:MAG: RDD family protein [Bordetella sp.]|nr:MAG: RDD family protein [Bordetella sp.]